ncbi:hypothetical protein QUA54_31510 [Microcoleus sp. MOSTC5]|uniref:hypothetical protein n=1 Tax=Microcoleus sp. MOSTC5 TaxID=3055378 RepID=UPI002FD17BC6
MEVDRNRLDWEVGVQREENQRLKTELETAQANPNEASTSAEQQRELPTALELLNAVIKRRKISKIREVDVAIILDILGGNNEA